MFILHNSYSVCLQVLRLHQHFQWRIITFLFEANFLSLIFPPGFCSLFFFDSAQIHETIETINQLKTQREFMLSFARDPQGFINDWLQSQCRDLKVGPFVSRLAPRGTLSGHISCRSHSRHCGPICNVAREKVSAVDHFKAVV